MNRQQMIEKVERSQIRDIGATPRPGDTVKVHVKVIEGDKRRIQIFQGIIINVRGEGARKTFTVRKVSMGVAVERIFPFSVARPARPPRSPRVPTSSPPRRPARRRSWSP
ncbi:MAG: large subunit ribosomal protein L19 [bacterium]|nr:MAG: large subunit ribosomal protein L19 [bacterium]